jgi:hypothetical protein
MSEDSRQSMQLRLHLDRIPSLPSEIWLLLLRHRQTKADQGEFVGLTVTRNWSAGAQRRGPTRVDTTVHFFFCRSRLL